MHGRLVNATFRRVCLLLLIAAPTSFGCSSTPSGGARETLNIKEPDAKFLKPVERDPFPRADGVKTQRR